MFRAIAFLRPDELDAVRYSEEQAEIARRAQAGTWADPGEPTGYEPDLEKRGLKWEPPEVTWSLDAIYHRELELERRHRHRLERARVEAKRAEAKRAAARREVAARRRRLDAAEADRAATARRVARALPVNRRRQLAELEVRLELVFGWLLEIADELRKIRRRGRCLTLRAVYGELDYAIRTRRGPPTALRGIGTPRPDRRASVTRPRPRRIGYAELEFRLDRYPEVYTATWLEQLRAAYPGVYTYHRARIVKWTT